MINVAIIGGSGYVGGELIRLLLFHPQVKLAAITTKSHIGEKVSSVHKNLFNICDLEFEQENLENLSKQVDLLFFALPHGESMKKMKKININKTKIIDLSADFRIKDEKIFKKAYGLDHNIPKVLSSAVYGLTEWNKKEIQSTNLIANPGCFPTGALLALLPLAKTKLLTGNVIIDSKTGSTGSGIKPTASNNYSERAQDFWAYNIFAHRHKWEIEQELSKAQGDKVDLIFTTHSAPMIRGIFTTAYVFLNKNTDKKTIEEIYKKTYENSPFVRIVDSPHSATVALSNYCDIAINVEKNKIIITSAIDNLVKGAAGQAVQNMNIMFGFDEMQGLEFPGSHP